VTVFVDVDWPVFGLKPPIGVVLVFELPRIPKTLGIPPVLVDGAGESAMAPMYG
jgi:hypothetical protein